MLDYLREFNIVSVIVRMLLAALCGFTIGMGRSRLSKTAGLRTFIVVSVASALAILVSLFEYNMQLTLWAPKVNELGLKFDVSRIAAQVISGAGFLAAGAIIGGEHNQVHGLTTATSMFAAVCLGLAAGAGLYEVVIFAVILIYFVLNLMANWEARFKRRIRNMNLLVEFDSIESIESITNKIKEREAEIADIDIEYHSKEGNQTPYALIHLVLSKDKISHSDMLTVLAELDCVQSVKEMVS